MAVAQIFGQGLVEAGTGRPVIVFGRGFADSPAHQDLARRFRVIAVGASDLAPRALGEAAAAWALGESPETVGFLGMGGDVSAALWAAQAAGEHASAVVLVSPTGLPINESSADPSGLRPLLTLVKAPKAVLIGTLDQGQSREAAALYRTRLSRSNVILVFGAGGDIATDRPEGFRPRGRRLSRPARPLRLHD